MLGPDIVFTGEIVGIAASEWSIRLHHFVSGSLSILAAYIGRFARCDDSERFVLANELGDGRVLVAAPSLTKSDSACTLHCPVAERFPRIRAQELGSQWAVSPVTNDLYVENRQIARVAGLASLPQSVTSCLSLQRGESPFYPEYGVRFAEYLDAFRNSPWFGHLLKLDVIRQSSIPHHDRVSGSAYTPLRCVERVWSIDVLADEPTNRRFPIRVDFDVNGVGRWQHDIAVFVPPPGWQPPARSKEWLEAMGATKVG